MNEEVRLYAALRLVEPALDLDGVKLRELVAYVARHHRVDPFDIALYALVKVVGCAKARIAAADYVDDDLPPGSARRGRPPKRDPTGGT